MPINCKWLQVGCDYLQVVSEVEWLCTQLILLLPEVLVAVEHLSQMYGCSLSWLTAGAKKGNEAKRLP